jgi:mono/diheme cytochrome c family protein
MKFSLLGTVIFVLIVTSACSRQTTSNVPSQATPGSPQTAAATPAPDEFAATRVIFKEQCSKCHMENGEGGQVTVDNKKLRVPSFKQGHALKHTDEDFVDQITTGGDGMPAFKGKLKPAEINELVRFVRKEFQGK